MSEVKLYHPIDSHSDGDLITRHGVGQEGQLWVLERDRAEAAQ